VDAFWPIHYFNETHVTAKKKYWFWRMHCQKVLSVYASNCFVPFDRELVLIRERIEWECKLHAASFPPAMHIICVAILCTYKRNAAQWARTKSARERCSRESARMSHACSSGISIHNSKSGGIYSIRELNVSHVCAYRYIRLLLHSLIPANTLMHRRRRA
jgi:hypothetical protein